MDDHGLRSIEYTKWNRLMLEERIPARLNHIYQTLGQNHQGFEEWRLALTRCLVGSVERNCKELVETIEKDRLSTAAWIVRNLLELWVWVKYCGVSTETAWRFHEDAARDLKGLHELFGKEGVFYAEWSILAVEAQLGIPSHDP